MSVGSISRQDRQLAALNKQMGSTQSKTLHAGRLSKRLCDCMWDSFDPRERTICGIATVTDGRGAVAYIRTASSLVSIMEFGKVERTLSKKLKSTVVVYKSKSKPGYVYRLTVKMDTSIVCC